MGRITLIARKQGITTQELEYCLDKFGDYPYCIKLKVIPPRDRLEQVLKTRKYSVMSDSMGGSYWQQREGILFAIVQENFFDARDEKGNFNGKCWFFVKDEQDHQAMLDAFPELVEDPEPFLITISGNL